MTARAPGPESFLGEIDHQELDSSAIREELGWGPQYDLDRGLAAAWSWYERHVEDR